MSNEALTALQRSHSRFARTIEALSDDQIAGPSYDDDWSIGQVCSHLASSAIVFGLFLDAGLQGTPAPGVEQFQPIWDTWDAKTPVAQARESIAVDRAFIDRVDALTDEQRSAWRLDLFGADSDLTRLLSMRLAEHAIHTWDIEVTLNAAETVAEDAVALIADNLSTMVGYVGKPTAQGVAIHVHTTAPERNYDLAIGPDGTTLAAAEGGAATASLTLTGESFARLIYGRLDPDHTPDTVVTEGVDLDQLRTAFPGV